MKKAVIILLFIFLIGLFARFGRDWHNQIQLKLIEKKYDGQYTTDQIPTARYAPNFSFDLQHLLGIDDKATASDGFNNPGNFRVSSVPWYGKNTPSGNKFETFKMLWHGYRAIMSQLRVYNKKGYNTLSKMMNIYAPPSDNNPTAKYIATVASDAGIGADDDASTWINSNKLMQVAKAIAKFEQKPGFFVADPDLLLAYESLKIPTV